MIYATALAVTIATSPCSWDHPGANRYMGDVPTAIHNYTDIPETVRKKLQSRMEKHLYDDVAEIRKDTIKGKNEYTDLRDMHFGMNQLCRTVTREKWKSNSVERGLVYCEDQHCIIVPTVCGNVSRITKKQTSGVSPGSENSFSSPGTGRYVKQAPIKIIEHSEPIVIGKVDPKLPEIIMENNTNPIFDHEIPFPGFDPDTITGPTIKPVIPAVPEVSSLLAMAVGLVILLVWMKRQK